MNVIPYSRTPEYTRTINDNDIFVIEQEASGFSGMKKITVKDFLQPVYDRISQSVSSIYKFMGSVQTYEDLPVYVGEQSPIPVYGILSGQYQNQNFAWITDHWDPFGNEIDLSDYITEDELEEILRGYSQTGHTHTQADITDLNVLQSLTIVKQSSEDGGQNVFSVQSTGGDTQEFTIKNGNRGTDSINYRIDGAGSITRNADGSYSPNYMYLQAQKLIETIEAYYGRILISSEVNKEWTTVYPVNTAAWEDQAFLQFYIPANTTALRIRLYPSGTDYSEITDDNFLYEEHVSIAQTGPRGYSAKSVELIADSYVFKVSNSGVIVEPDRINFTINLQNTQGIPSWVVMNGDTTVKSGTSTTFSISAIEMDPYDNLSISTLCDGISDTCTIVKVSDGSDGTSPKHVICENESFGLPVNSRMMTSSNFSTQIEFDGYSGIEPAECRILSVSGLPRGMTYTTNVNILNLAMPISTPVESSFGKIIVSLSCSGTLLNKVVSWSVSKEGDSAKSIAIEADSYVFKADDSGQASDPQEIVFTAEVQNLESTPVWTAKYGNTLVKSGNGSTFRISAVEMGSYSSLRIRVSCDSYSDSCTILLVSDGLSGYSTTQVRLFKRGSQAPDRYAGDIATYTFATGSFVFGPGGQDGWSTTIPSGAGDLYVIYASAHSQGESDAIDPHEWTEPAILSEESVMGQSGYNSATVLVYCRSVTTPTVPNVNVSYRFAGGEISNLPQPWSKTIPSGTEDLWVTQATAFSRDDSDTIAPNEWSNPVIISYNGKEGYNTAQIFLYKRSNTLPEAYDGSIAQYDFTNATLSFTDGSDGWSTIPGSGSGNLYIICVSISSRDSIVQINPTQWTNPQLYVLEPEDGTNAYNNATVFIYTRANETPQTPQITISYSFETGDLSGLPSGWSKTPPTGSSDLWVSQTVVTSSDLVVDIPANKWAAPVIIAANGAPGSSGWSSAQVILYKRSELEPLPYDGSSVIYTFSTGEVEFTGDNDGWSQEPPSGSNDLYVIRAAAASVENTDVIASYEWSTPILYVAKAADGSPGQNGYNTATVLIYKRSPIEPILPSEDVTYTFATGTIQGLTEGWTASIPEGTEQVWVTQATAFSRSTTDVIESTQWLSPPTVMAKNGKDVYNIVCTNETFNIPTDEAGKVVNAFTTTVSFIGYLGSTVKDVILSDLQGVPVGMNATINGNVLTIFVFENVVLEQDYGVLSVTASCDSVSFSKYVTWSKSKRGATGQPGEHGTNWYQGTILTGETTCTGFAGKVNDCYLNTDTANVYQCIEEGDEYTAIWQFVSNIKGEDGQSFTVVIESSNGNTVRFNEPFSITLSCKVYLNTTEVTDVMEDWRFRWKRNSGDPIEDERWNTSSKAIAHKTITITNEDANGRSVFNCEVDLNNFRVS